MRALIAILLTSALLPLAAGKVQGDAPAFSVGDFWDTTLLVTVGTGTVPTTVHDEVKAIEKVTIGASTYDAVRSESQETTNVSLSGVTGTTVSHAIDWRRVSDGALLKAESHTNTTISSSATTRQADSMTVYDPPCNQYRWPLAVGASWTETCHGTSTSNTSAGPQTTTFDDVHNWTVLREESVTVAAGTFDAFVLSIPKGNGANSTTWYAPSACAPVKVVGENLTSELQKFKCGASSGGKTTPPTSTTSTTTTSSTPSTSTSSTPPAATAKTPGPGVVLVLIGAAAALALTRKRS